MIETTMLSGEVQGALLRPKKPSGLGVVVLTGSSGRVDTDVARLFAERGATALAQKWWGGEGQAPVLNLIPLEVFSKGIDLLKAQGCERIVMLGTSNGAQAALLVAVRDPRVDMVIAISPTDVVWPGLGPSWPPTSSFTWEGRALPFIVWDPRAWPPMDKPRPVYRPLYEKSLRTFAEDVPAASIPVELARAEIILVAGAGDLLWPSDTAAHVIAARLERHGKKATIIEHPTAGHSPVLPGAPQLTEPMERAWGGTPAADRELGAAAWTEIARRLDLTP